MKQVVLNFGSLKTEDSGDEVGSSDAAVIIFESAKFWPNLLRDSIT